MAICPARDTTSVKKQKSRRDETWIVDEKTVTMAICPVRDTTSVKKQKSRRDETWIVDEKTVTKAICPARDTTWTTKNIINYTIKKSRPEHGKHLYPNSYSGGIRRSKSKKPNCTRLGR
jgi:hypothetical protein